MRDQIMKNKDMFSERELNHAEAYQRSVEDPYGNWPPKDPETGLYKLD